MWSVVALADDLTGALETGAKFAAAGTEAVVRLTPELRGGAPVLVIDTETRHAAAEDAAARVCALAREALARGARFIFKKTDSTLRGNIGAELGALRRADPVSRLVYAPAYPLMGRTVRGGRLYVHGVPVSETEFARDALSPVSDSSIARVLARQTNADIDVWDGETEADVAAAARAAAHGWLAAGPAAMAEALAAVLDLPRSAPAHRPALRRAILVNGSRSEVSRAQLAYAESHGIFGEEWKLLRLDAGAASEAEFARRAGEAVRAALEQEWPDVLIVFGGDTAYGILDALGRPELRPWGEAVPGVPLSRTAVRGRELHLVTKAGGFGGPDVLGELRNVIREAS